MKKELMKRIQEKIRTKKPKGKNWSPVFRSFRKKAIMNLETGDLWIYKKSKWRCYQ